MLEMVGRPGPPATIPSCFKIILSGGPESDNEISGTNWLWLRTLQMAPFPYSTRSLRGMPKPYQTNPSVSIVTSDPQIPA